MWWQKYIGIPFVNRGRTAQGLDCGGLIGLVLMQEQGKQIHAFDESYNARRIREAAAGISSVRQASFIPANGPGPFVVAVFSRAGFPYHVAMCVSETHALHAKDGEHVKLQRLTEMMDYPNLEGFYCAI